MLHLKNSHKQHHRLFYTASLHIWIKQALLETQYDICCLMGNSVLSLGFFFINEASPVTSYTFNISRSP
jgi:hypothetical protein